MKFIRKGIDKIEMKKNVLIISLLTVICVIIGVCLHVSGIFAGDARPESQLYYEPIDASVICYQDGINYVDAHLLVTASDDAKYSSIRKLCKKKKGEIIGYISMTNDYQINFPDGKTYEELQAIINEWSENDLIEYVNLEFVYEFSTNSYDYSSDPWIAGSDPKDTSGKDWNVVTPEGANWWAESIMMPHVWEMEDEYESINIGVVDTYFDVQNEDLTDVFAENGIVGQDDINVSELYKNAKEADKGAIAHGTVDAGIIAARNNGFGICGISQNASLYGVSLWGGREDSISSMGCKYAIAYLLTNNVKAINISMGFPDELEYAYYQEMTGKDDRTQAKDAVIPWITEMSTFLKKCLDQYDFLLIASAGNGNTRYYNKVSISEENPYGYEIAEKHTEYHGMDSRYSMWGCITDERVAEHIMVVGSVDLNIDTQNSGHSYRVSSFSNPGNRVNIYAPGGYIIKDGSETNIRILSDYPTNITDYLQGTSQAAPMVTGTAALVWGINPELSAVQVKQIICQSAEKMDSGERRLNTYRAVNTAKLTDPDSETVTVDQTSALLGFVYDIVTDENGTVDRELLDADIAIYDESGNELIKNIELDGELFFEEFLSPGTYTFKCSCKGYIDYEAQITLEPSQTLYYTVYPYRNAEDVQLERFYTDDDYDEYAEIRGYDNEGNVVWKKETDRYQYTELRTINEICKSENRYYYVEDGSIIALNVADGKEIWRNNEYGGTAAINYAKDEDGNLYLTCYSGPDLFAVSSDGKTLVRTAQFYENLYCPYLISCSDKQIEITMEGTPFGKDVIVYVNKADWSYYTIENLDYQSIIDSYKKSIGLLNGNHFKMTLDADIDLNLTDGKHSESLSEYVDMTLSIIDNDLESMQMSGTCSVAAGSSGSSYDVYYQNGQAYAVINSAYGQVVRELDTIPSESLMKLDYDFTNATISNWSEEDNKISFRADGSVLNLDEILKDIIGDTFDDSRFTCDAINLELVKDSKGRPESITLIYTVNIWVKDGNETATGTADYVEKITFSEYGTAAVQHLNQ